MRHRRIYDVEYRAHFVTFSCYKRRRLLDCDQAKRIVLGALNAQLSRLVGRCVGFVIMPDHVHAILWFAKPGELSEAMKQWKRMSSIRIKELGEGILRRYWSHIDSSDPVWQARFYAFHLSTERKIAEKLEYMHLNPVRAGLAERASDWRWSSARWYEHRRSVGVPIHWLD